MIQTLFLKSNLLHIRTNEGEFVVINPGTIPNSVFPCGWSGGVELIKQYKRREGWSDEPTARDTIGTVFARLLPPEEEKKDDIQPKRWEESTSIPSESDYKEEFKPTQPTPNFPKGGTTFTESAYKEFEGNCSKCGHPLNPATAGYQCTNINCPSVESSEPQERDTTLLKLLALKRFTEDRIKNLIYFDEDKQAWAEDQKSAPSESQEEHAIKFAEWMMKERWYNSATDQDGRVTYYQQYTTPSNRVFKQIKALYDAFKLTRNP